MNFKVTASSGLKIRSGPGINFEELTLPEDRLRLGDVVIEAETSSPDPGWLAILMDDETIGYVARQYVQEIQEDFRQVEAKEIAMVPILPAGIPLFQKELISKFGYPKERAGYLTTIDLREFAPHLSHVRDFEGNRWSCRIYGHEAMAGPLKKAFGLIISRGLAGELKTYDGCFCIRKMTGGSSYSVHSWALAVDFNAKWNPYGGEVQFSEDLIMCFAESGFEGGALWNTPDGMHFQLPWTRDWRNSENPLAPKVV